MLFLGIAIGIDCFEWYQILNYCFTSASFALSWVAFVVVVIYRRDMYKNEKEIEIRKREKAIRVLEALKRGGGGGQKAPPKGNFSWAITEDGEGTEVKKALWLLTVADYIISIYFLLCSSIWFNKNWKRSSGFLSMRYNDREDTDSYSRQLE